MAGGYFSFNYDVVATTADGQIVFKVHEGPGYVFTPGMKLSTTDRQGGSSRDIGLMASYSLNPACHALIQGVCAPILTMGVQDAGGHPIAPIGPIPTGWTYSTERGQLERAAYKVFMPVVRR